MQFKENVRIKRWTPVISVILSTAEKLMNHYDWIPELTITSCNDSTHKVDSQHYKDAAVDIRSKNFLNMIEKGMFKSYLQEELGPKFIVIFESIGTDNEHFHVQLKRTEVFP